MIPNRPSDESDHSHREKCCDEFNQSLDSVGFPNFPANERQNRQKRQSWDCPAEPFAKCYKKEDYRNQRQDCRENQDDFSNNVSHSSILPLFAEKENCLCLKKLRDWSF